MKVLSGFKFRYYLLFALIAAIGNYGCNDPTFGYSDIPEIELIKVEQFKDSEGKDSILAITIAYQDGDGNIGLTDSDTLPPFNAGSLYQNNLLVGIQEYSEGKLKPILSPGGTDTMDFSLRIPDLQPTGKIKEISGEITVRFDSRPLILYPDTIQCEITLADRALNLSNTIRTGLIVLSH